MRFHIDIPSPDGKGLTQHVMEGILMPGPGVEDLLMHERARPPPKACYWMMGHRAATALDAAAALEVAQASANPVLLAIACAAKAADGLLVLLPEGRA